MEPDGATCRLLGQSETPAAEPRFDRSPGRFFRRFPHLKGNALPPPHLRNIIIRGNLNVQGMVIGPGGVRINGGSGSSNDLPDLVDAKGQKYRATKVIGDSFNFVNGSSSRTVTILFQPNPGQAEPRELVLFGTRTHTIAVPFHFENLPLP